jgi:TolB-like protein/class 3 adenylate cyclase/Tfp pilus assembly protein PilF
MSKQNRSSSTSKRKLAAIMFTDIVGYTSLMGKDESLALRLLKRNREIHRPLIKKYHGQWLKEMGDGILVSFTTIYDAVYCAGAIQDATKDDDDLNLRIGIHVGEVVQDGNDVFGDGVNIASRIETMTPSGSVWVSEAVYKNIRNKNGIIANYEQTVDLKNVEDPLKVYSVEVDLTRSMTEHPLSDEEVKVVRWLKPALVISFVAIVLIITGLIWRSVFIKSDTAVLERSIAVLPFANLSTDEGNAHFSVGVQEAILNHISKFEDLRVISRSSMEQYEDSKLSIPEIAREVGVNYILEGSVQKANDQVRVTVQLINGTNDDHIWAENYDRDIREIFVVQSEIAQKIAQELKAIFNPDVIEIIEKVPTENMQAYEYYIRGLEVYENAIEVKDAKQAAFLYQKAIELDSNYADPYLGLARIYADLNWRLDNYQDVTDTVITIINKAIELDPQNSMAWGYKGWYTVFRLNNLAEAEGYFKKAIELNPNNMWVYYMLARGIYPNIDKPDLVKSLMYAKKAARLMQGEELAVLYDGVGYLYLSLGMYEEAANFYDMVFDILPSWQANSAQWWLNLIQGKYEEALVYARRNVELYPEDNRSHLELARTYAHMGEYDTALLIYDTWYSMYNENRLDVYDYTVYSDEYKFLLIETGTNVQKGEALVREKLTNLYKLQEKDAFNYAGGQYYDLMRLNAMMGNKEDALEFLAQLENAEFAFGSISWAINDPLLENIRNEPEFISAIERGWERKWELQEQVRKMEAEEDLKELSKR